MPPVIAIVAMTGARAGVPNLKELRAQLIILTVILWGASAINFSTSTAYLRTGQVKGTDFVQFHALARMAATGSTAHFSDSEALRRTQLDVLPESSRDFYPALYGPQVAIALAPLGRLGYYRALVVWLAISTAVYFALLVPVIRHASHLEPHLPLVLVAAAAFPPFWQVIQHGQLSVVALASVVLAWHALRTGHRFTAGAALGVLAYKPSLAAPALAVLAVGGEWRMLTGAGVVAVGQVLVAIPWVGVQGIADYERMLVHLPGMANALATKPENMHSLRTFWRLLVPFEVVAAGLYFVSAAAAVWIAGVTWRRTTDASLRMAVICIGVVLASPHMFVYDLVVLAPAWIWLTNWWQQGKAPRRVEQLLFVGYIAPLLAPLPLLLHFQLSTVCLAGLLYLLWRENVAATAIPRPGE